MYIAIDIGGTNTRIAASESLTTPLLVHRVEYANTHDFQTDYARMIEEVKKIPGQVDKIGIGFPGNITADGMMVTEATNIKEWEGRPFIPDISRDCGCSIYIDNDGTLGALGIAHHEIVDTEFIYITWGTGIGGASVTWKEGQAIATVIQRDTWINDWENSCGGNNIINKYGVSGDNLSEHEWQKVMNDFLAHTITMIRIFHPHRIVFGGGITMKHRHRLINIGSKIQDTVGEIPEISITALGNDVVLYGALELIRRNSG